MMLSEFTEEQKIKIKPYTNKPPKTEGQLKQYISADAFKLLRNNKMIIEKPEKGKKSIDNCRNREERIREGFRYLCCFSFLLHWVFTNHISLREVKKFQLCEVQTHLFL